jgi:manganese-dependent ADP-ribose/CDP-alcohol diphosphatase
MTHHIVNLKILASCKPEAPNERMSPRARPRGLFSREWMKKHTRLPFFKLAFSCLVLFFTVFASQAQDEKPLFSFGLIADIQYCDCDSFETRFYRNSPQKLENCLKDFADENLSFMVSLGDLIDKDIESYDVIIPKIKSSGIPMHYVLGNHEFDVEEEEKEKVIELLGMEKRYYDFSMQGWRFVITDGNYGGVNAWPEGSRNYKKGQKLLEKAKEAGLPQAQKWNGSLDKKQLKWLGKVLKDAQEKGEKIVLFSHFPIYPWGELNLYNDRQIVEMLEATPGVVAWINGHNHEGAYEKRSGIHYFTMRGMVETPRKNSYGIVDVYRNRLVIRGKGRESLRVFRAK